MAGVPPPPEGATGSGRGGLMASRELQGGRMLMIIRRPQVVKFMFIWEARRKFFPAGRRAEGGEGLKVS